MLRITAVVLVGACASVAAGEFAYDTFGPDWDYEFYGGSNVTGALTDAGYCDTANMFESGASGSITDIWLAMATYHGPNIFELSLMADDEIYPGEVLQTWVVEDMAFPFDGTYHEPVHLEIEDSVYLEAGTNYWLSAHAGDDNSHLVWDFTKPGIFEWVGQRFEEGGEWNILDGGWTSAYAIAVPTPASLSLLLLGVFGTRRRRG